jgi:hypothetical protein
MMNKEGNKMTKYAVYQLPFEHKNARDLTFMAALEIEEISDQFELVAHIDASSFDDVFRISNCCGEDPKLETLIDRAEPMHSVSVGDILHDLETDETVVVANYGFAKIYMKEAAE